MALSKTTQDHDEIKAWAEKRGGRPADVESTETAGEAGIIRLEFPDAPNANDANLKEIDWEPFFEKFDKSGLAMVYQEVTSEGAESNFYKFVHPENLGGSKKAAANKTPSKKSASVAKTAPATKAAATKTPAGPAAKKAASKTSTPPAKKVAPVKAVAAKTSSKKAPAKKAAAPAKTPPTVAKKVAASKATAKPPAKKAPAKKTAAKAVSKKSASKKK